MMIDYLTLMLINMAAGFSLLGFFVWRDLDSSATEDTGRWTPPFAISGLVAAIGGFMITFTWPLPKPYSMMYGEMSVLFGSLLLGLAWALAKKWELLPLAIYAFFAGAAATLLGTRIIDLGLTTHPLLSGVGFVLSGACGIFSPVVVWQSDKKGLRIIGSLVLFAASAIWAWTGCMAYWGHMVMPK